MKSLITLITSLFLLVAMPVMAGEGKKAYATGGTDVGTTLCYAVISADGQDQKTPIVTFLNVTSDKAGSVVTFYTAADNIAVANYGSTTTSIPVNGTNGFAASDVIIIKHVATDTYERRILDTFTSSTNLTVTVAPTTALVVGDIVWKATAAGTIPVGNATVSLLGDGIYSGQKGKPLLLDLDGTSAVQINAVCAKYE